MTEARWPASIPQAPDHDGWSYAPQGNVAAFKPDIGAAILRRRSTVRITSARAKFTMSSAEYLIFERFFYEETGCGSLTFRWADPQTESDARWQFADDKEPFRVEAIPNSPGYWSVSMTLTKLPG